MLIAHHSTNKRHDGDGKMASRALKVKKNKIKKKIRLVYSFFSSLVTAEDEASSSCTISPGSGTLMSFMVYFVFDSLSFASVYLYKISRLL